MPFTAEQLAYGGKAALDFYLKNDPVDQVNIVHPLLKKLLEGKQEWGGGLQNVVETLRYQNDSNFQSYFGDGQVSYNRKRTLDQAKFTWGSFHDGFGLNEDELAQNGIIMTDDRSATASDAEKVQLTSIIKENQETLKTGFEENFDLMIHRDGSQSATDIPGLDALVSTTPSVGTVGGIAASNAWWQNYANLTLSTADADVFLGVMETAWQKCIRVGGSTPDFILAGSTFISAYRKVSNAVVNRQLTVGGAGGNSKGTTVDASTGNGVSTGLYFKGVEVIWDPVFETLDIADAPVVPWEKRCYILNTKRLKLRPIKGHWMVPRRPPRVYDRYVHYWALTSKAAFTTGKRNAHAVLALA